VRREVPAPSGVTLGELGCLGREERFHLALLHYLVGFVVHQALDRIPDRLDGLALGDLARIELVNRFHFRRRAACPSFHIRLRSGRGTKQGR
jgi:hypothetical protein